MKITRILIFLCLAAVVPFVMGQKGCGGQLRFGEEVVPPPGVAEEGAVQAFIPPPGGEGEVGEGPPSILEKGDIPDAVCEEARPEAEREERPARDCSRCVKNLPVEYNPSIVTSLSVEKLANSSILKDFFGAAGQMILSQMESRAEVATLFDLRNNLKTICMACGTGEAVGGLLKTTMTDTTSSSMGDQGSGSGTTRPPDEYADQSLAMESPLGTGLSPLDFCGEYILVFDADLPEGFSLCSYAQNLLEQRVNYMPSLAMAIHWSFMAPHWLSTVAPALEGFSNPLQFQCSSPELGVEYLEIALYKGKSLIMMRKENLVAVGTAGYMGAFVEIPVVAQDRCPYRWKQLPEGLAKLDGPYDFIGWNRSFLGNLWGRL
jgi:hypothetical protein